MSIDRLIYEQVHNRWRELGLIEKPSQNLAFMKVQGKLSNNASIIALVFDADKRRPVAAVKIPRNPACTTAVDSENAAMTKIRESFEGWEGLGRVSCEGFIEKISGAPILFQNAMTGHSMVKEVTSVAAVQDIYTQVLPWLLEFHQCRSVETVLEGDRLEELVTKPIRNFFENVSEYPGIEVPSRVQDYLRGLSLAVTGEKVRLCGQHGDFNAHNLIVRENNESTINFGVIDWEDFSNEQLPIHDLNHFFISNSKLVDMNLNAEDSFIKFVLSEGWYRDRYIDSVKKYEDAGMVRSEIFWKLTPLYMACICLRLMTEHRSQESTIGVWITRANKFIERLPTLTK